MKARKDAPGSLALSRRQFMTAGVVVGATTLVPLEWAIRGTYATSLPGGTLDPRSIPKYVDKLVVPPAMPRMSASAAYDYYEIAVRQFDQDILPERMGKKTPVWGYGSIHHPGTVAQGGSFNYPSFTIEATYNRPARIKWINDLKTADGTYLPHLLPVDPTLRNGSLAPPCSSIRTTSARRHSGITITRSA